MFVARSFSNRVARWIAIGALILAAGCGAQQTEPQKDTRLVWPPPPEKTRIQFLRSIASDEDVQHDTTFTQKIFDFLAGEKPKATQILEPNGIAVSDDGNVLYVSDHAQDTVFVFDFGKKQFRALGPLEAPAGVALDSDNNLYVVEQNTKNIVVFDPSGKQIRTFTDKSLQRPNGLAIDRQRRRLYVADAAHTKSDDHSVKIFSLDGALIGKIGGSKGNAPGHFMFPTYVWVGEGGEVYVTDSMNCRVQEFTPNGDYLATLGKRGDAWGEFERPKGVAVDSFSNVYVVDSGWSNVQIFNPKGRILLFFGGRGPIPGMLKNPTAIAIDKGNHIFVGDYLNHRVEEYQLVNTTAADSYATSESPANKTPEGKPKS